MQKTQYRNSDELNYYGSDYNKYLHEYCSKEMTVNNVDVIQYKRSYGIIRIIESKHSNERLEFAQRELLNVVASLFKILNTVQKKYKLEIFIVRGDPPYNEIEILDLYTNKKTVLTGIQVKQWSEFELEL